jgi:glucokinase
MSSGQGLGLVADIGGTNARFALVETDGDRKRLLDMQQLACADYPTFEDSLATYLKRVGAAPRSGVVAVAGAVKNNTVRFTNLNWHITPESLTQSGFPGVRLINDYAAQALALPLLDRQRLFPMGPHDAPHDGTLAVMGPGSGLGVAALIRQPGGEDMPLATEGGHADFAAVDDVEMEIVRILTARHGRASVELLLSGSGLCRLHELLMLLGGKKNETLSASDISERGLAGDWDCRETLLRFCAILGSVSGDIALTLGATGGVFIAGGIAPRILKILEVSRFRERFEAKAPMVSWLKAVPSLIITDTNSALLGAARVLTAS